MRLREIAVGIALGEAANDVREEGGDNRGAKVRAYLSNSGIAVPAPWCAAMIQWCSDAAGRLTGLGNPLDDVAREALVMDYVLLAGDRDWIVDPQDARPGDLVCYEFGAGERWNHVGFLASQLPYVVDGERKVFDRFYACEGNTSPGVGETRDEAEREGDGVYLKLRKYIPGRTLFIRWDGGRSL